MKTHLIVLTLFIPCISFAQSKKDLIQEIEAYRSETVSNASFDNEFSEVWNAVYIIATEEYNTITRESESKGYIEAKQETETYRESMTVEILGNVRPYKVSFQVKKEKRTKNQDGSLSNWQTSSSTMSSSYQLKLRLRLYELLNGPLQLSEQLMEKIETYNATQSKDRKKVLKGRDY